MELSQSDKYLIVVGIIFCIALAVLSPYIASGDPDGLEKSVVKMLKLQLWSHHSQTIPMSL